MIAFIPLPVSGMKQIGIRGAVRGKVDAQMPGREPDSDLMRLDAASIRVWKSVPERLFQVLRFGLEQPSADPIYTALSVWRFAPHALLEIDGTRLRKSAPLALDFERSVKVIAWIVWSKPCATTVSPAPLSAVTAHCARRLHR